MQKPIYKRSRGDGRGGANDSEGGDGWWPFLTALCADGKKEAQGYLWKLGFLLFARMTH